MEPHGPPRRGRPLGIYDDTSDSMDNIGGEWDDHPVRGFGEDGSRRSTRGGPHRRRGAESRGMTDLMDEMSLHERQRRAGGRDLSHIDAMLDEVELHEREQRAGGRGTSHIGAMLDDMESDPRQGGAGGGAHDYERSHLTVRDLPMLKERRAYMMEGMKNARNGEERRTLQVKFNMMTEDIARHEYERRESGKMPRGMGGLVAGTASNSRQSRTGGREPREMSGEFHDDRRKPLNLSELPKLRSDRASMMKSLKYFVESGNDGGCRMAQDNINIINEDIARLELQHRDGSKMPRGMGAPTGHRDREDYTDEESDDYPLGPRRGHSNASSRRVDLQKGSQILKHEPSFENHDASLILAQSYSIGLGKSAFFLASLLSSSSQRAALMKKVSIRAEVPHEANPIKDHELVPRRRKIETDERGRDDVMGTETRSQSTPGGPSKVTTFTRTAHLSIAAKVLRLNVQEFILAVYLTTTTTTGRKTRKQAAMEVGWFTS
ncbi:MAG: hypothetical protein ALECFALPRED_001839 [Alectoria fallacina]|uniref:Uncharacterized protein n=1 Tax=Alectoria fallacina TaxID=1903189 RepID=A0A8H3IPW2_9LECA|nr:MAG: hypothetical protein ALECFALPRED_001839 [Alectoria fallacina]